MNKLEFILERAEPLYNTGDPSHDFQHVRRVVASARKLGAIEKANLDRLLPAAVLHDIVNLPKNHPERQVASQMAAQRANTILGEAGYNSDEMTQIKQIIIEHSFSLGKKPSTIEAAVLQDADRLDALGAVGIMRTVTCGARMGTAYFHAAEPFAKTRDLNDKAYTLDHFFVKLLKLPELMNTESARAEAVLRANYMQRFLDQLKAEIL